MSNEISSVKSKIAKLLALGTNNTSGNEAKVAMAKAQNLLEEWALTIDDIDLGGDEIIYEVIDTGRKSKPELSGVLMKLAEFANVKLWVSKKYNVETRNSNYTINFIGYETDIDIFKYFWSMLNTSFEFDYAAYKNTSDFADANSRYHGRAVRKSFVNGFTRGVNDILEDLIEQNETVVTSNGTALVPLKNGKVEEFFKDNMGFKLTKSKSYSRNQTNVGYGAGNSAGSSVRFNSGVGRSGTSQKMIGA